MVFAGAFPFSSYGGINREERKHRKVLFLFNSVTPMDVDLRPLFFRAL
jgi:hypothetical protein